MNARQLEKLGVPRDSAKYAIAAVQALTAEKKYSRSQIKERIRQVVAEPTLFVGDVVFDALAKDLLSDAEDVSSEAIEYSSWGGNIDDGAFQQMARDRHFDNLRVKSCHHLDQVFLFRHDLLDVLVDAGNFVCPGR